MKSLIFLLFIIRSACLASSDIREIYIKAVKDFSLCGNALMPWGDSAWRPDEVERLYVEQAKLNQLKMKLVITNDLREAHAYLVPNVRQAKISKKV